MTVSIPPVAAGIYQPYHKDGKHTLMYKKKQLSAVELFESFRKEARGHLSDRDIEFCDKLILSGMSESQMDDQITDYIYVKGCKRRYSVPAVEKFANFISNYITIHRGLLLSYSPQKKNLYNIPEKFYMPAPNGLGMAIMAIPEHGLIVKTNFTAKEWYGSQRGSAGTLLSIAVYEYVYRLCVSN